MWQFAWFVGVEPLSAIDIGTFCFMVPKMAPIGCTHRNLQRTQPAILQIARVWAPYNVVI